MFPQIVSKCHIF